MPAEKVAASPRRDGGDGRLPAVRTRRGKGSEGQGPVQKTRDGGAAPPRR